MRAALVVSILLLALSACANQPAPPGVDLPGFWWGLLHGLIAPFALIAEIFTDVRIYAFPNSGGWYDFGYIIGILSWGGGPGVGASRRRRRRNDDF